MMTQYKTLINRKAMAAFMVLQCSIVVPYISIRVIAIVLRTNSLNVSGSRKEWTGESLTKVSIRS